MKDTEKRTEQITVRVSKNEKELLKSKAKAKGMSMTNLFLLSAVESKNTAKYQPILKGLAEIKKKLNVLLQKDSNEMLYDLLDKVNMVADTVCETIRNKDGGFSLKDYKTTKNLKDYPAALTVKETAEILRVSSATVYKMIRHRTLPAVKVGREKRIPKVTLKKLLNKGIA